MPKIEVDEAEFRRFQQLQSATDLMLKNPKSRRLLEQAHRTVDPNAPAPLLDHEAEINAPLEALRKEFSDYKTAAEKKEADADAKAKIASISNSIEAGIARLRQARWTDEGIAAVRKLMDEKGILDVDDAVAIFERHNPPPPPIAPRGAGAWNFIEGVSDGEADLKKLLETKADYEPVVDKMARDALAEVRGQSSR